MKRGNLIDNSKYKIGRAIYKYPKIYGRNLDIYKIFCLFKKGCRIVQLMGETGMGKTNLVHHIANYLFERRNLIEDFFYQNFSVFPYISNLTATLKQDYQTFDKFCQFNKNTKKIFILDNCDSLILNSHNEFLKTLSDAISKTHYLKFIIVTKSKKLDLQKSEIPKSAFENYELGELRKIDASNLFIQHAKDSMPFNDRIPFCFARDETLDLIGKLSPKNILIAAEWYKQNKFRKIFSNNHPYNNQEELKNSQNILKFQFYNKYIIIFFSLIYVFFLIYLISEINSECFNFLLLLTNFPAGISTYDLNTMRGLNLIEDNWIDLIHKLTKITNPENEDEIIPLSRNSSSYEHKTSFDIKPGEYFWLNIQKDRNLNIFIIKIHQFLINAINNMVINADKFIYLSKGIRYLAYISKLLIKKLKETHKYQEKLLEFSEVCNEGLWSKASDLELGNSHFLLSDNNPECKYLKSMTPEKIFELHEINFCHALNMEEFKSLFNSICFLILLK